MPSIDGGSSTSIDYAPHMYVLREGGDYQLEEDYVFVGNAETTYEDDLKYGSTYQEQLARIQEQAADGFYSEYHLGVSLTEGLVGDVQTKQLEVRQFGGKNYLYDTCIGGSHQGIPSSRIPEEAKRKLITVGIEEISVLSGHIILNALGIELPTDLELLNFGKLFNGTPKEQSTERMKDKQWQKVADALRQMHGIK
ncbi:MAG: hypothetical protein JWM81_467 [Candidatus Saccharibacteria bacterium]|nr:hypothetical protein [Candidatus Saccharibacteria bacterium]